MAGTAPPSHKTKSYNKDKATTTTTTTMRFSTPAINFFLLCSVGTTLQPVSASLRGSLRLSARRLNKCTGTQRPKPSYCYDDFGNSIDESQVVDEDPNDESRDAGGLFGISESLDSDEKDKMEQVFDEVLDQESKDSGGLLGISRSSSDSKEDESLDSDDEDRSEGSREQDSDEKDKENLEDEEAAGRSEDEANNAVDDSEDQRQKEGYVDTGVTPGRVDDINKNNYNSEDQDIVDDVNKKLDEVNKYDSVDDINNDEGEIEDQDIADDVNKRTDLERIEQALALAKDKYEEALKAPAANALAEAAAIFTRPITDQQNNALTKQLLEKKIAEAEYMITSGASDAKEVTKWENAKTFLVNNLQRLDRGEPIETRDYRSHVGFGAKVAQRLGNLVGELMNKVPKGFFENEAQLKTELYELNLKNLKRKQDDAAAAAYEAEKKIHNAEKDKIAAEEEARQQVEGVRAAGEDEEVIGDDEGDEATTGRDFQAEAEAEAARRKREEELALEAAQRQYANELANQQIEGLAQLEGRLNDVGDGEGNAPGGTRKLNSLDYTERELQICEVVRLAASTIQANIAQEEPESVVEELDAVMMLESFKCV